MATLLVGFDSAWTPGKRGAIVAALQQDDGTLRDLGDPHVADFREAEHAIRAWQAEHAPFATILLLDQPTIVDNPTGQRPVENIVSSCVSLRYGGMQPANTARADMFGEGAPIWPFLARFGGAADPLTPVDGDAVFETYPVFAMIALGWLLEDARPSGRLPKYNPERKQTFSLQDWQYVCRMASSEFRARGLVGIARWIDEALDRHRPTKVDQDRLDACLCLLVALYLAQGGDGLMVGNLQTGYIVVPHRADLQRELEARCVVTGRQPSEWVRKITLRIAPRREPPEQPQPPEPPVSPQGANATRPVADHSQRFLREAIALAHANVRLGGRPFGAVVVRHGEVIATGVNEIHRNHDPTAHAELLALRAASRHLGTSDLSECIVYASGHPCPMCLAAMRLARIAEVNFAYTNEAAEPYGLSTGALYADLAKPFDQQAMRIRHVAVPEDGEHVYAAWRGLQSGPM